MGVLCDVFGDKLEMDGRHYLMCLRADDGASPTDERPLEAFASHDSLLPVPDGQRRHEGPMIVVALKERHSAINQPRATPQH